VKKSGNAEGRNGSGAQIIEHRAKRAKHHWRNDRGHRRKPIPKFAQSFNAALRRVAGDQRRIDGADRDARDPVGMKISLGQCLINSGLIRT
jgi:hypothetical protein